jgi:hypothetical protein
MKDSIFSRISSGIFEHSSLLSTLRSTSVSLEAMSPNYEQNLSIQILIPTIDIGIQTHARNWLETRNTNMTAAK